MRDEAKLNRFSIALRDFEKAEEFLTEARNHSHVPLVHEALVFSAIICYFRPFTNNETSPSSAAAARLELSDFLPLSSDEICIHETCKNLRNKALAHAEVSHYPTRADRETGVISSTIFSLIDKAPGLEALSQLIGNFIRQCHNKRADYVYSLRNTSNHSL